ncbi:MAG: putative protein kinase domain protein [Streblomastix strix]|uniref:non-specific serine/threonine protein kinase n=1 Tax=Streblomastix strix TaxID=222440 RepID=A0A5J4U993_9EUKA|nr:MAG: putative protein kinase domain protein [Streblomastix strix]
MVFSTDRAEEFVGSGTYANVYKARNLETKQTVVVKVFKLEGPDEEEAARKEVFFMRQFNSPFIVKCLDSITDRKQFFIIAEYCECGTLDDMVKTAIEKKMKIKENQILSYLTQLAMGLREIHQNKILHRDIKAQNVFLTEGTRILKLGDFGVSKCLCFTSDMAQTITGTPFSLAPEVCSGQPYNYKSDIWGLGVLLYYLMTKRLPFVSNSMPTLLEMIKSGETAPISEFYSAELRDLCMRMLKKV